MSSTYNHYTSPSSLPSDYNTVARFAASQHHEEQTVADEPEVDGMSDHTRATTHHGSVLASDYVTPFNPTMGPLPDEFGHRSGPHHPNASETTPLLAPPVPRIVEDCDEIDPAEPPVASYAMYKEELGVLMKYTLPVFG